MEAIIPIKPLSVNQAWQGKRFKTSAYKAFERDFQLLLPKSNIQDGPLKITCEFGFSNKQSDLDNPFKLVQDGLSKKYGFNDNRVYEISLIKSVVKKRQEFIKVKIEVLDE